MVWSWLLVLVLAPAVAWSVRLALRVPAVWRGDQEVVGSLVDSLLPSGIGRRTSLPFALTVNLFVGGLLLLAGGAALGAGWVARTGVWGVLLSFLAFGLWQSVKHLNRPHLLAPPSERSKAGTLGQAKARRKRRAAGRPPTVHEVEVFDVRPPPEKPDDYPPYFVAICSDDECDWMSDPVGSEDDADPEATVRRQAAEHSDRVAKATRRPVG
jgi:hypothetical protein